MGGTIFSNVNNKQSMIPEDQNNITALCSCSVLVLTKTNQHVKYKSFVINSSQDNEQKPCLHYCTNVTLVTLPFDQVKPKSKGSCPSQGSVINSFQDNERKPSYFIFTKVTHVTLSFDLVNPKSIVAMSSCPH